jgi:predicted transglutaminase-like cysteine proteinase
MMVAIAISNLLNPRSGTVLITALLACAINASSASAGSERPTHVPLAGVTSPPIGWIELCSRQPNECAGGTTAPRDVVLTHKRLQELVRVNTRVNETVKPLTDLEHWGVAELWSYPDDGYGDCEDYVLLKRRMLMQSGWPIEALLITVVRDKRGAGHAVLTVKTNKGEFILDNETNEILLWSETGYYFVKRQSQNDPNVWVSLGNPPPAVATATSR